MAPTLPLADGFPTFTEDDWRAAVARTRRGVLESEGVARAATREGGPLHQRQSGARPIVGRPPGQRWRIVERIDAATPKDAARAIGEAAAGGATGIEVAFAEGLHPLAAATPADLAPEVATALAAAMPQQCVIRVGAGEPRQSVVDTFLDVAEALNAEVAFAFDPVAARALGRDSRGEETARATAAAFDVRGIAGVALSADGRLWHAGGATEEQELAVVLATFVSHARLLDRTDRIGVALTADADQFRSIAKFRAMRLLLARVLEIAGFSAPRPHIHAETAWRTLSARDPQMNILRATSAAFGAAVGGADSITILPFDAAAGENDAGRRLARNTQIILAEEAHLFRVADPAAGSGAIEALTAMFAEAAWGRFQAIEAEGGIVAAIEEGALLREIAETRETRLARVARGDLRMVGVNAFRGEATAATVRLVPVKRTGPLTFKRLPAPFEETP